MSTTGPSEAVREPCEPEPPASASTPEIPRPRDTVRVHSAALDLGVSVAPAPAPAPRRWGLGAYLLAEAVFLVTSLLLVLPYVAGPHEGPPPASVLLLSLTVPTLLSACAALLVTVLRGHGPRIDLGLRLSRTDVRQGLVFGCAGLLLSIPAAALWSHVVGAEQATSAVAELFAGQRFSVPFAIAVFLVVWLVAPVCEEIVYRGLLWGAIDRNGANRWWAFGLTTCAFALAHFEFTRTPLLLVIAVPIGLARLYTGRLGASIVAHQVNNLLPAVALLLLLLGVRGP